MSQKSCEVQDNKNIFCHTAVELHAFTKKAKRLRTIGIGKYKNKKEQAKTNKKNKVNYRNVYM